MSELFDAKLDFVWPVLSFLCGILLKRPLEQWADRVCRERALRFRDSVLASIEDASVRQSEQAKCCALAGENPSAAALVARTVAVLWRQRSEPVRKRIDWLVFATLTVIMVALAEAHVVVSDVWYAVQDPRAYSEILHQTVEKRIKQQLDALRDKQLDDRYQRVVNDVEAWFLSGHYAHMTHIDDVRALTSLLGVIDNAILELSGTERPMERNVDQNLRVLCSELSNYRTTVETRRNRSVITGAEERDSFLRVKAGPECRADALLRAR